MRGMLFTEWICFFSNGFAINLHTVCDCKNIING